MIHVGDVIQATEKSSDWGGCLLVVTEIKDFGVQAGMKIPFKGTTFVRLKWDQFERIGTSLFLLGDSNV